MIYEMRLHPAPFELIKFGKQTIEVRLFDEKRQQIKVGDEIVFIKRPEENEQITVQVTGLSLFKTFKELFQSIDKAEFGYSPKDTLEYQVLCMHQYYTKEDEQKYGVLGIHVKPVAG